MPDLGLSPNVLNPERRDQLQRVSIFRPFVKVELAASVVPGDPVDSGRWYRFVGGVSTGDRLDVSTGTLVAVEKGALSVYDGSAGVPLVSSSDSFSGQSATFRFQLTGLMQRLLPRIRPMDRLRISVILPGFPAGWVLFDGFVRAVDLSAQAGNGWSNTVTVHGAGGQYLLAAAIFNWQGFVHPDHTLLNGPDGQPLAEAVGMSARPPHILARGFLNAGLKPAMGLKIGDLDGDVKSASTGNGTSISDYLLFDHAQSSRDWSSWPGVAFPLPWPFVQTQSGSSFWGIVETLSEPVLHEVFMGYRSPSSGGLARPTLIHRPRPFPGLPEFDSYWLGLDVVKVGGLGQPSIFGVRDTLSADRRPNAFHWTGLGFGDHSKQEFQAKLAWGWAASNALINRFGYASYGITSRVAPLMPGAPLKDYTDFSKTHLQHYAQQEVALPLLHRRELNAIFIPCRPGMVIEDSTLGDTLDKKVTGYVTSVDFALSASADSYSMNFGVSLDRCVRGTDAAGYPATIRGLVPDLTLFPYAGKDIGNLPPPPAVGGTYQLPPLASSAPAALPNDVYAAIKAASKRQSIPAWLIAHVLHNETGFGRFWGNDAASVAVARQKGIGQITTAALSDLSSIGYTNPDGTPFTAVQRGDVTLNVHGTAGFLKRCQGLIEAQPGGFPSNGESYYSWVARAYTRGATETRTVGESFAWAWPSAGEPYPDYMRYWSPDAILKAQSMWGWLG